MFPPVQTLLERSHVVSVDKDSTPVLSTVVPPFYAASETLVIIQVQDSLEGSRDILSQIFDRRRDEALPLDD
jgi:hypothetical protein